MLDLSLPWLDGAEIFAINTDYQILGGIYSSGDFGVPSICTGNTNEALLQTVRYRFRKDTGKLLAKPWIMPIARYDHLWVPPFETERSQILVDRYCGVRTHYVYGTISISTPRMDKIENLKDVRLYSLDEALGIQAQAIKDNKKPDRLLRRIACLVWLQYVGWRTI